jgi:hypothetical protein
LATVTEIETIRSRPTPAVSAMVAEGLAEVDLVSLEAIAAWLDAHSFPDSGRIVRRALAALSPPTEGK